jgi:hypothetical protein
VFFAWQQKVVLKVSSMSDERVKQKAMETVADIYGKVVLVLRVGVISADVLDLFRLSLAFLVKYYLRLSQYPDLIMICNRY